MRRTALFTAVASLLAHASVAAPWVIDPGKSTLSFTGTQAGDPFTGKFTKFSPVVEFDPEKPEAGKITVTVDMASANIDDKDKQESLPTEDWFFTEKFPTATFTSTAIKRKEGAFKNPVYEATGDLTLRGITKPITIVFYESDEKTQNGASIYFGEVNLNRQDFSVGQGQWKDDQWVAFPVTVAFHLYATPGK